MPMPLQGVYEVADDDAELAPADKVAAARKVWELREQMTAQMAQHRKVSGAWVATPHPPNAAKHQPF